MTRGLSMPLETNSRLSDVVMRREALDASRTSECGGMAGLVAITVIWNGKERMFRQVDAVRVQV